MLETRVGVLSRPSLAPQGLSLKSRALNIKALLKARILCASSRILVPNVLHYELSSLDLES